MKSLLVITILAFAGVASAYDKPVGPAGCGLGHVLFGKDTQVLASTTNDSTWTNMFGITSGTSGCVDNKGNAKLDTYVEANRVALANDIARGNGETVAGLSKLLNCQDGSAVNASLKSNYQVIFSTQDRDATEVSQSIRDVLKNDKLACSI